MEKSYRESTSFRDSNVCVHKGFPPRLTAFPLLPLYNASIYTNLDLRTGCCNYQLRKGKEGLAFV
jgi:hypothetical protein